VESQTGLTKGTRRPAVSLFCKYMFGFYSVLPIFFSVQACREGILGEEAPNQKCIEQITFDLFRSQTAWGHFGKPKVFPCPVAGFLCSRNKCSNTQNPLGSKWEETFVSACTFFSILRSVAGHEFGFFTPSAQRRQSRKKPRRFLTSAHFHFLWDANVLRGVGSLDTPPVCKRVCVCAVG